ncbi:MAG: DNA gyrase inhibitor YacG [Candidatus Dadabacteria bacterium]|nr:MAG: DNA gyrase inhibitor YacG [Candidatus Dadabacteria bacterium]
MSRPCPRCGQPALLTADNPARPFCCDRCKKVDLGEWLLESIRIPDSDATGAVAGDEESGSR